MLCYSAGQRQPCVIAIPSGNGVVCAYGLPEFDTVTTSSCREQARKDLEIALCQRHVRSQE